MKPIYLYLEKPVSGERLFLVMEEGRKWALLLDPYTLQSLQVPISDLRRASPATLSRGFRRGLDERRKAWKRYGFRFPVALVKRAVAELEKERA